MQWVGRTVLIFMFALYWGGLTFYTGIVVRIIHFVLNDPMDGGLITQKVTQGLQLLGFCTLPFMAWNDLCVFRHSKGRGSVLFGLTCVLALALLGLVLVHAQLDAVIDIDQREVVDRGVFDAAHRRYNQTTTIQWLAAVVYLPLAIYSWKRIDSDRSTA